MAPGPTITAMFCRHCGYNLHGLPANRCAECGRTFDPNNRKTYASAHSRRRWARRILTSFLMLSLVAAATAFSLWWPWHRNAAAVRMVQRCGGTVETTTVGPQWLRSLLGQRGGFLLERVGPTCDFVYSGRLADADLEALDGSSELRDLNLGDTGVTDSGLAHLKNLNGLRTLSLRDNQSVIGAGSEYLENLKGLQSLDLARADATDAGIEHLKGLNRLQTLDLSGTRVTDAALEYLKDLKRLQTLDLSATRVTDAGFEWLRCLTELRILDLSDTKVTDAGTSELEGAFPRCTLTY